MDYVINARARDNIYLFMQRAYLEKLFLGGRFARMVKDRILVFTFLERFKNKNLNKCQKNDRMSFWNSN